MSCHYKIKASEAPVSQYAYALESVYTEARQSGKFMNAATVAANM
jgi:hypothetical protein